MKPERWREKFWLLKSSWHECRISSFSISGCVNPIKPDYNPVKPYDNPIRPDHNRSSFMTGPDSLYNYLQRLNDSHGPAILPSSLANKQQVTSCCFNFQMIESLEDSSPSCYRSSEFIYFTSTLTTPFGSESSHCWNNNKLTSNVLEITHEAPNWPKDWRIVIWDIDMLKYVSWSYDKTETWTE